MRIIRILDGHRYTPLVFKSPHFPEEDDIDACSFPQESDFPSDFTDSEYSEDSIISRASRPLATFISEFGHRNIRNTSENDASKSEDEAARCRSQQRIDHSKSENDPSWTPPQQSALNMHN